MSKQHKNTLYIVAAVWPNTKGNHAGMYHLAQSLGKYMPMRVKVIRVPTAYLKLMFWAYRLYIDMVALWLRFVVKKGDTVWLMEYLLRTVQQSDAAAILRGKATVIATAHLVPSRLDRHYSRQTMLRKIKPLDRLYVLGNSLRDYFIDRGVGPGKVKATFHYVDTGYYVPGDRVKSEGQRLRAIAMGNMERDMESLAKVIALCPGIDFTVCLGMNKTAMFDRFPNVRKLGFVSENELLAQMQEADVSINTMFDTIGSNVITTSLACGLPVIASEVGSITDYVDDGIDGCLFGTPGQAAAALRDLDGNRVKLQAMSRSARRKALSLSLENFAAELTSDLEDLHGGNS